MPVGAPVLEAVQSPTFHALIFVLIRVDEADSVRWIRQRNPALPMIVVLARENARLREELLEEGVAAIVSVQGLTLAQIRRKLSEALPALGRQQNPLHPSNQQLSDDLHTIRSTLTAVQGNAELALQDSAPTKTTRKQLQEVLRGVAETERILRRLERILKALGILAE
ncbi:MAG: response regulator [Acidobacteria bacterium]|nr:response regulator [Acidobacteriota bacterium]